MSNMLYTDPGGISCAYGDAAKFSATIIDQMNCLYLLSYLVTADRQMAEQCLTRALDDYVEGRSEFLSWAAKEGHRAVMREAIHIIRPVAERAYRWTYRKTARTPGVPADQPFASITSLGAFERFAFVMCTIENLSEEDSAALLNGTIQDVALGRELAQGIVAMHEGEVTGEIELFVAPGMLGNQLCSVC